MSQQLVTENLRLRQQLADLLTHAQQNQQILERYQAFDLQFIAASGFRELIETIFRGFAPAAGLDMVTLILNDPDQEIRRILNALHIDLSEFPQLLFVKEDALPGWLSSSGHGPQLGEYAAHLHQPMFPRSAGALASVAVVPLMRRGRMIGYLNLGSKDPSRFKADMRTDFIEHLAAIVAICVENVINNEKLKHIGLTDPLTGVSNRRYVELRLTEEIGRSRRHAHPLCCMYIDIDRFKQINDRFGHQAGDLVLCDVAARIKAELRLSDALGRFGGEEFVALLVDTDISDALNVAERVRRSVAGKPLILAGDEKLHITVSIGVATLATENDSDSIEASAHKLVALADQALYRAKENGRNRVVRNG
jgi:two-component system cell cycle response regulator